MHLSETEAAGLLLVIGLGFGCTLLRSGVDVRGAAAGLVPNFAGTDGLVLAAGILGATVMPPVIYVHSALTQGRYGDAVTAGRTEQGRRRLLRAQRLDVLLAMGLRPPALLLVSVHLAALAVALRDPSEHLLAGFVVLTALLWRLPVARSAISHVLVCHPVRDRRARRTAAAPAVVPAAPVRPSGLLLGGQLGAAAGAAGGRVLVGDPPAPWADPAQVAGGLPALVDRFHAAQSARPDPE